jgi:flagella basal body P-ring formation protein FlgA
MSRTRHRPSDFGLRPAVVPVALLILGVASASPAAASGWVLDLAESARAGGGRVTLAEIVNQPVPERAGSVVVYAGGLPGRSVRLEARSILRRLVTLGLAEGVRLRGASSCEVLFEGGELAASELVSAIEEAVAHLIPPAAPDAPASWVEVAVPRQVLPVGSSWRLEPVTASELNPGRNLVPVEVRGEICSHRFTAEVTLHAFAEIPQPTRDLAAETLLTPELFRWHWTDLADLEHRFVTNRDQVTGMSAGRRLPAGRPVRCADLRPTPLVHGGESVELRICRGAVAVAVRAIARRDGTLGQNVPVRNELTGRVVTARVIGPGVVDWRP